MIALLRFGWGEDNAFSLSFIKITSNTKEKSHMPSKHGPQVEAFYHSKYWTHCRTAFVAYKRGKCEICGKRGNLVHHKILLTEENVSNPEISLNFDNLMLLCKDCHNKIHADIDSGRADKPTIVEFTPSGDTIVRDKKK